MYMGLHAMAARMHTSRTTPGGDRGGGGTTRASPDATDKRAAHRLRESRGSEEVTNQLQGSARNHQSSPAIIAQSHLGIRDSELRRSRSHVLSARALTSRETSSIPRGAARSALAGCCSCPPITRAPLW